MVGQYDKSIIVLQELVERQPKAFQGHLHLAATYMMAGNEAKAREEAAEVLRIDPNFSLDRFARTTP